MPLEAVVGHGGVGDALFRHEGGVEVGVVGRVVEVVVGVDDVLNGLVGQGLGVGADVARAVAAVDHDGELVAGEQVAVVAVVLDFPSVGRDLLGGEVGLVHRDLAAVGILDHGIVVGGEVDGGDGRPDGGGVDLRDAVLDVEGAAGADARRDLAAGFLGEGARLVGAGERCSFSCVFCGEPCEGCGSLAVAGGFGFLVPGAGHVEVARRAEPFFVKVAEGEHGGGGGGGGIGARDKQAAAGQRLGESLLPDSLAVHG